MTTDPGPSEPERKPPRARPPKPPKPLETAFPRQKITTRTETESIPVESPEEVASRLRREEAREAHELFRRRPSWSRCWR